MNDISLPQKAKKLIKKLQTIKESFHYYAGHNDKWSAYQEIFTELEDYLVENSKSMKLHDIELAKKIKEQDGNSEV